MANPVRMERRGLALVLTFSRPEVKNALNLDAIQALAKALKDAASTDAHLIVIEGEGGDFSSGGDIADMVARRGQAVATYDRLRAGLAGIVEGIIRHDKPVLARVDGVCMGAGAGVALACDALLATSRSTFGFPFVKVGLVPDTATSWTLPHIVGVQNARRLLLSGETIDAAEALRMGLATKVVADAKALDAEVEAWTQRIAALPPTAVRDAKRLLWDNRGVPLGTALVREAMTQGLRFTTDEHGRAVDAFLAKKKG